MDRADRAINAAWPHRTGATYVTEMQAVLQELQQVANQMAGSPIDPVDLSKTYSYMGSVLSDLAPALGKDTLIQARENYQKAEEVLGNSGSALDWAKLDFNLANTLRQIDPKDQRLLREARRRLLSARPVFEKEAPQFLAQVDQALPLIEQALQAASLYSATEKHIEDLAALKQDLQEGKDLDEVGKRFQQLETRQGQSILDQMQGFLKDFSTLAPNDPTADQLRQALQSFSSPETGESKQDKPELQLIQALLGQVQKEEAEGKLDPDRARALQGLLDQTRRGIADSKDDIEGLMGISSKLREMAGGFMESNHYLTHGIDRPPAGSLAAELVESNWQLRRYLIQEGLLPNKSETESKEIQELMIQASRVDQHTYEAAANDKAASTVDQEELRPLALAVRKFAGRKYSRIGQPVWGPSTTPTHVLSLFYSGPPEKEAMMRQAAVQVGMMVTSTPAGQEFADARWTQLNRAMITVFDLSGPDRPDKAAVAYELGIALTLSKPVIILREPGERLPFDVAIDPLDWTADPGFVKKLATALRAAQVWVHPSTSSPAYRHTVDYIRQQYTRPHPNTYVDQTLQLLGTNSEDYPDTWATDRALHYLLDYLKDGQSQILHPVWLPIYPPAGEKRVFHIMPFSPDWADWAAEACRQAAGQAGVQYIRGDEAQNPDVIASIWEEIAMAGSVIVDLTGFNANVALELGMAHTLGKRALLVAQGDTIDHLFPMISKMRVARYGGREELEGLARNFLGG